MAAFERSDAAAPLPDHEIYGKLCEFPNLYSPTISYGQPFDKVIGKHVKPDAKAYVLASRSLCSKTDALDRLKAALGSRIVGVRVGMASHTIYQECLEVAAEARSLGTDTVISLGAGSLADAAKFICSSTANEFKELKDLADNEERVEQGAMRKTRLKPNNCNLIMIPTSLSGGEHTIYSGITDRDTRRKYQIWTGGASVTILDPWLALDTPMNIWLQSGVRGIDHGVEHACGSGSRPECVDVCVKGLQLLVPGLLACVRDKDGKDVKARLNTQLGVALNIAPLMWQCWAGASHGIGHMLGPMGVGHGETSCILLPAVCRYNKSANGDKQRIIADALWEATGCADLFAEKGLKRDSAELADLLDVIIRALGMPRTLREKGIEGEEKLNTLAEHSLKDFFLWSNPIPISDKAEVMKILREVEG